MNNTNPGTRWPILLVALAASGCNEKAQETDKNPSASLTPATGTEGDRTVNDFPTLARVEYVLQCMLEHGGQNYDNLYHCACAADTIASKMSFEDFGQAQTFTYLFSTPGERGGQFRDPPESQRLRGLLKDSKALAQAKCFPDAPEGDSGAGRK